MYDPYVLEKSFDALETLALLDAPLGERVINAYIHALMRLRNNHLAQLDEVRERAEDEPTLVERFAEIRERFSRVDDPVKGGVRASVEAMDESELSELAKLIFDLTYDVIRLDATHPARLKA